MRSKFDTALSRSIDVSYVTNEAIVLLSVLGVLAYGSYIISVEGSFFDGAYAGLKIGALIFLSWALTRELDPGHEYSAFMVIPFVLGSYFRYGHPSFVCMASILIGARLLVRTKGLDIRTTEQVLVMFAAMYCAYTTHSGIGILISGCLILDGLFEHIDYFSLLCGSTCLCLSTAVIVVGEVKDVACVRETYEVAVFFTIAIVFFMFIYLGGKKLIYQDVGGAVVERRRVVSFQMLMIIIAIISISVPLSCGTSYFLWALITGTSIHYIAYILYYHQL